MLPKFGQNLEFLRFSSFEACCWQIFAKTCQLAMFRSSKVDTWKSANNMLRSSKWTPFRVWRLWQMHSTKYVTADASVSVAGKVIRCSVFKYVELWNRLWVQVRPWFRILVVLLLQHAEHLRCESGARFSIVVLQMPQAQLFWIGYPPDQDNR